MIFTNFERMNIKQKAESRALAPMLSAFCFMLSA